MARLRLLRSALLAAGLTGSLAPCAAQALHPPGTPPKPRLPLVVFLPATAFSHALGLHFGPVLRVYAHPTAPRGWFVQGFSALFWAPSAQLARFPEATARIRPPMGNLLLTTGADVGYRWQVGRKASIEATGGIRFLTPLAEGRTPVLEPTRAALRLGSTF